MNLSTSIYRICALLLFFVSLQAPLYAMQEKPNRFLWLPTDVISLIADLLLPKINPSFDVTENSSDLIANLSAAIALLKSNKYFNNLLSPKIIKYKNMIEAANAYDEQGFTPLISTITNSNYSIDQIVHKMKQLIKAGADVDMPHGISFTSPLSAIFTHDRKEDDLVMIARLLLESGADVETSKAHESNRTVFATAAMRNKLKLAQLFIEYGANVEKMFLAHNKSNSTPLGWIEDKEDPNYDGVIKLIKNALKNKPASEPKETKSILNLFKHKKKK